MIIFPLFFPPQLLSPFIKKTARKIKKKNKNYFYDASTRSEILPKSFGNVFRSERDLSFARRKKKVNENHTHIAVKPIHRPASSKSISSSPRPTVFYYYCYYYLLLQILDFITTMIILCVTFV